MLSTMLMVNMRKLDFRLCVEIGGSYCSGEILAELEEKMHMQYQKTFRNIMHGPTTYSEPKLSLKWSNISLKVNLSLSLCWSKTG